MVTKKFTVCFFSYAMGKVSMMNFDKLNTAIAAVKSSYNEDKIVNYEDVEGYEYNGHPVYRVIIDEVITIGKTTWNEAVWVSPYLMYDEL